ncbi:general transcription factor 3C polypeptide 4-like [Patiria miniata]|uniref:Transcription factor IIIC 90kDa subunit N-terminal domain-containing protein n=1 Tax=Patiria miniata TaxID=46514 RepID=A0A913Z110_PATMI|nr:general transcription factor 3C polypeptide 4-like [Patiria miniata]
MEQSETKMAAPIILVHSPVSSDAISWSEDNRIAIATPKCVIIFSLQCDPTEQNSNFVFHKSIIKPHAEILELDVGIAIDFEALNDEERRNCLVRSLLIDRTLSPPASTNSNENYDRISRNSFKLVRWSPAGTREFDSVLLACLALDHRLTVNKRTSKTGNMTMVVDLSLLLSKLLPQRGFAHINEEPRPDLPAEPSLETKCVEFKRRVYMLAAVAMDWSGTFRPAPGLDRACGLSQDETWELEKESFRLLAVAMKSGHVAIWKFRLHLGSEADISLYNAFDSGYQWPVSLAWCREPPLQTTSQSTKAWLAVGDIQGCISVWSIQEENETTSPTFTKCLDVWVDQDLISVSHMAWTNIAHKEESSSIATLVVTKGPYLMVFLVDLGSGTVVRSAHNSGKNPILSTSLCVFGSMVLTNSSFGETHRTVIDWTKSDGVLETDVMESSDANCKSSGITISPHGVYIAKPVMHRISRRSPYPRTLNISTVGNMETAVAELLDCQEDLSEKTDLLEFLRQNFVNTGDGLPQELESVADGESAVEASSGKGGAHSYTLRLRRYLLLMKMNKVGGGTDKDAEGEKESDIQRIEGELRELHVLTALQFWQQMSAKKVGDNATAHTTTLLLMADWLSTSSKSSDEPIRSLVTEVYKSNPHETEVGKRETCDLCGEIVAFTSAVSDACPNGHGWSRCQLSLQLCQTTAKSRECLYCSAMALSAQNQSDSAWLRRILRQCCLLCASMFV